MSGPSGAGKGTLVKELIKRYRDLSLSISATTRPARAGERAGIDYHFIPVDRFIGMRDRGEFLESAEVHGYHYGTPRAPIEQALTAGRDVLLELDIQGALAVKRTHPGAVLVFIEPPSFEELKVRLRNRGTDDLETISKRVTAAYDEVKMKGEYDHIVVNDDLGRAVDELVRILELSDS